MRASSGSGQGNGNENLLQRRDLLKAGGLAAAAAILHRRAGAIGFSQDPGNTLRFSSGSIEAELSRVAPEFLGLNIDGLGKSRRGSNIVDATGAGTGFRAAAPLSAHGLLATYRRSTATSDGPASWAVECSAKTIVLTSQWSSGIDSGPFIFRFKLEQVHSTVLGVFRKDKTLAVPVLLHFPGQGSMRLSANVGDLELTYAADRPSQIATLSLPGATSDHPRIIYTLEVIAIYPELPGIAGDSRFDAFRRNWLNALQLNPNYPALANNTASDTCAFCYYEFADIAALTSPLAEGLTALDLVRQTLDRILAGGTAYGLPGPGYKCCPSAFSDALPSMMIAAADCVRDGNSDAWLVQNYEGIRRWAETMLATDSDGDGLFKYSVSGNAGIWKDGAPTFRPSNWWDTIGFGHEDAYGNALAYRALRNMVVLAGRLGKTDDAARYRAAADKLRDAYYPRFYDPVTGVLGGWRSADGQLHDYYFLWVNGIAIHYGLVAKPRANDLIDRLMAKMKEVGYRNFHLGLPGNLVTVAGKDCVDHRGNGRFGCGLRPDNSDGFEKYENGGATAAFAFFTLAALYDLGRKADADEILFAMLDEYDKCGFDQRGANGRSNDWRQWDGTPWGYEGLLADDYYALLAVGLRQTETRWQSGFRPETRLT